MLRFVTCYIFDKFSEQSIQVIVSSDNDAFLVSPILSRDRYRPIPTIPSLSILLRIISCSSQSKNLIDRRLRDLRDWIVERLGKRCSRYEKEEKKEKNIHSSTIAKSILFRKKETRASQFLLHLFSASPWYPCSPPRQLTNFFRLIILNDLGQLHVPSDHRHLVGSLVRVIQAVLLRASEQQLAYAGRVRVVHSANVQRRVAGRVTRVHVGTVKKQVIQVLDQVVAAGLRTCGGEERGRGKFTLSIIERHADVRL